MPCGAPPRLPRTISMPALSRRRFGIGGVEVDLPEMAHRLLPQRLEAGGEALREIPVPHQERREATIRHEGVVEWENHDILVDDVEGVAELSGVPHAGDMTQLGAVRTKELH